MKSKIALAVLIPALLLFLGIVDYRAIAKTPGAPKLFLPETNYAFGEVHEGDEVRHTFIIKNKGASALDIIDVKTD